MPKEKNFCGCCGREINHWDMWCNSCEAHVIRWESGKPAHERTYFAQHGIDCPYQVPDFVNKIRTSGEFPGEYP